MKQLIDFADANNIPYQRCGKLIVATAEDEIPMLHQLYERGKANGIMDLKLITAAEIKEKEPYAAGLKAIYCGETSIINYSQVSAALVDRIISQGVELRFNAKLLKIINQNDDCILETSQGSYKVKKWINCAGLHADQVLQLAGYSEKQLPCFIVPFKGEYYSIKSSYNYLVNSLIYPVPDIRFPFLGVHFTTRINGSIEAGPNAVLALAREGYRKLDISVKDVTSMITSSAWWKFVKKHWRYGLQEYQRSFSKYKFVASLQKLVPAIEEKHLEPGGVGIRAQAMDKQGKLIDDFVIINEKNAIHVLNAPSPAATSSLAIGDYISNLLTH